MTAFDTPEAFVDSLLEFVGTVTDTKRFDPGNAH